MEISKLIILICYIHQSLAAHSHIIPVENYETELQDLGQHVEIPETPVKVIKITKTVAVKIPVPYPVKVIEKVPYPVHVSKPYPVPVPQIVHVPQPAHTLPKNQHQPLDVPHAEQKQHGAPTYESHEGYSLNPYDVHSFNSNSDNSHNFRSNNDGHSAYDVPSSYQGYSGYNGDSRFYESKKHETVKQFPQKTTFKVAKA